MKELTYLNVDEKKNSIFFSSACLFEFIKYGHFVCPSNRIGKLSNGENYIVGKKIDLLILKFGSTLICLGTAKCVQVANTRLLMRKDMSII
jgi:hypothetical protein